MQSKYLVVLTSLALGLTPPMLGRASDSSASDTDNSLNQTAISTDYFSDTDHLAQNRTVGPFKVPQYLYGIYAPKINVSGYYGSSNLSYAELDALLPMVQWQRGVLFTDFRGLKRTEAGAEGNFGFGYRGLTPDQQYLYGAYAFYDLSRSMNGNNFQQITLGGEFKTDRWSTIANGYLPIGVKGYRTVDPNNSYFLPVANTGYENLYFDVDQEKAMSGFDLQEGYDIPHTHGLSAYLGGYYFVAPGVTTVVGPRARLEYSIHKEDGSAL